MRRSIEESEAAISVSRLRDSPNSREKRSGLSQIAMLCAVDADARPEKSRLHVRNR